MFIILFLTTLLLFSLYLFCSGGNKEHDKLLLELMKQPVEYVLGDAVYFKNKYGIELWESKRVFLKEWDYPSYKYEFLHPTFLTYCKVRKFIKQQSQIQGNLAEQEKTQRLNRITDMLKGE